MKIRNTTGLMSGAPEGGGRWLMQWITLATRPYALAAVLTLISAGCFSVFSWYVSMFAGDWLTGKQLFPLHLLYAAAALTGRYVFAHFAALINYKAGNIIVNRIRETLYPNLLRNSRADSVSSALLVSRVSDDLKPYFSFFIPYATASVLVALLLLGVSFRFEKWVGIILFISFMVIPLQMIMIGIGAESLHKRHINLFMKYSAVFYNRLQTIAEIVNLDNLKPQYRFLFARSLDLNNATTSVMKVAILSSAVLELFVTIAIAAVAIYLGISLLGIMPGSTYGKGYDFQIALFLLMLSPYFFFYLRKFVGAYHDRNRALAAAGLLMPYMNQQEEPNDVDHQDEMHTFEIRGLDFAYPDTMAMVLHNIRLNLPTRGLVLVKGISGSGKSTLLKILAGSLKAEAGIVSVNGHNNARSAQWLRENTSYMNQYPFIFDGTLGFNVFLRKEVNPDAGYPEFLNKILEGKSAGWHTVLTHNGKQLSGGERQLVTLARMMLFPKPIALVDEPTANLDTVSAEIIMEQLAHLAKHRLVIVASHEPKFEEIANTVLHLNWGEQMKDA